jgi:hypothetical protein
VAPDAVSVDEFPIHIIIGVAVTVSVGNGFTTKDIVFVLGQPAAFIPVTV